MGVWLAQPKLEADETIRWQSSANRSLSRWITSGGRLIVTNQRILFQPSFDRLTGKRLWECPLASVTGFGTVDLDLTVLAGGMRKRLKIHTSDGHEIFILNCLDDKMGELEEFIPRCV